MQNPPTIFSAPPPLPLPPPPSSAGQITVLPAPPPPPSTPQSSVAPSSVFQITVLPAPPPPPFAGDSSSIDFSPLEFLFAIVAIVTIPALIYTFIFAFRCSPSRHHEPDAGEFSGEPSVASERSRRDDVEVAAAATDVADVKHPRETGEIGGECPVCLSALADGGGEVRQLSVCNHSFHASCIGLWLASHSNCPICRAAIPAAVAADMRSSSNTSARNRDGDPRQGQRDANAMV